MVGIGYFPFFLSPPFFRAAGFLRAAVLPAALRAVFFAAALRAGALWAGLAALRALFFFDSAFVSASPSVWRDFLAGRRGRAVGSVSSTGSSSWPSAPPSTSTTSDQRR